MLTVNPPTDGVYTIQYINIGGPWLCQYYSYGPVGGRGGGVQQPD